MLNPHFGVYYQDLPWDDLLEIAMKVAKKSLRKKCRIRIFKGNNISGYEINSGKHSMIFDDGYQNYSIGCNLKSGVSCPIKVTIKDFEYPMTGEP